MVNKSDEEVMQECIDKCVSAGWEDIAKLYGVGRRARKISPAACVVPVGYGTIKAKSWIAMIVKGRPISPHTKHVMKRISNMVARGYHVVLIHVNSERVMRMYTTQEYKGRLSADQRRVRDRARVLLDDPGTQIGFVYDM